MAFDYVGLRDSVAEPLIAEFGKLGTIFVNIPANILLDDQDNPILDDQDNYILVSDSIPYESQLGSEKSHLVALVQTKFKKADNNGTLVEIGDVLYLVSTEGVIIDPGLANRVEVDGVTYQVVRIDPLQPGPVVMLWKVHARK